LLFIYFRCSSTRLNNLLDNRVIFFIRGTDVFCNGKIQSCATGNAVRVLFAWTPYLSTAPESLPFLK
jgi:hypothetical protein